MEEDNSSWFLFTWVPIFAAIIVSLVFMNQKRKSDNRKKKLPPGQMGLPLIGETMAFYKAQRSNRLFEEFVQPRVSKYGKIFKTSLMGSPTVVLNGAEANKFILSNEFKLVVSSWPSASVQLMGKDSIMEKQGETHRRLRGLIGSTLGFAELEPLVPKMCDVVQAHLDTKWLGKDTVSLYRSAKLLTFTVVFECFLGIGVKAGMLETFERVLVGVFAPPLSFPKTKFYRAKKARMEIERMLGEVVRERRKQMEGKIGKDDRNEGLLLSRLVEGMIRGEISEEEVIDNVVLLVFAAHDTTSFAIVMTFKMLALHQDSYRLLLQEHVDIRRKKGCDQTLTMEDIKKMKYTWQAVRESMRLFPPIFGSFRKAISDIEYEGFIIPKGWKMLWTTYGTHYCNKYFEEPFSFKPSRFDKPLPQYVFVPFGGGPRVCVGHQLAKMNILIFLHFVVTRFDWSLINPDEPIAMDSLPFPSQGMPIKISPKSNIIFLPVNETMPSITRPIKQCACSEN